MKLVILCVVFRKTLIALISTLLSVTLSIAQSEEFILSTFEFQPYIGNNLTNKGAITEIVSEAFLASENTLNIEFYPVKRAIYQVKNGISVGTFPVYYNHTLENDFIFSSILPGVNHGLLQKKNKLVKNNNRSQNIIIGIKPGSAIPEIKNIYKSAIFLEISTNEQLLKMLDLGRIDYLHIEKFTAADLMIDKFPNLIGKLEFIEDSFKPANFHIGFSKKHPLGKKAYLSFERGLKLITENGKVDRILHKHGLLPFTDHNSKKTLHIATVNNKDMDIMRRLSTKYEEQHPNIKIDWRVIEENILRRRVLADLSISDGQFDIVTIGTYGTPIWAKNNWIIPLTELPESYDEKDLIRNVHSSLSFKEQLFSLPFYGESSMTYYRKDLFAKANLMMPNHPTWEQIKYFASQIDDPKKDIYGICMRGKAGWGENTAILTSMVNTLGGQWFDMNWQPKIDSPEWKIALSLYIELITNFGSPNTHRNGYNESLALFSNGHCGMWIDSTIAAGFLLNPKKSKVSDLVAYAAAPSSATNPGPNWLWAWSLAIPNSSRLKNEALDFIVWATSKEYIQLVASEEGWGSVPTGTRYSTYASVHYKTAAPYADFVLNQIETSTPKNPTLKPSPYTGLAFVAIPEFPALGTFVGQKVSQVIQGNITIDEALKDSQNFAEQIIKLRNKD